ELSSKNDLLVISPYLKRVLRRRVDLNSIDGLLRPFGVGQPLTMDVFLDYVPDDIERVYDRYPHARVVAADQIWSSLVHLRHVREVASECITVEELLNKANHYCRSILLTAQVRTSEFWDTGSTEPVPATKRVTSMPLREFIRLFFLNSRPDLKQKLLETDPDTFTRLLQEYWPIKSAVKDVLLLEYLDQNFEALLKKGDIEGLFKIFDLFTEKWRCKKHLSEFVVHLSRQSDPLTELFDVIESFFPSISERREILNEILVEREITAADLKRITLLLADE
ncbi:MAG: hypothetical protein NZO16_06790, partial [Deltaproteobacteria bacterium]|nr:hypothetical protein [Deltaproteobacteria bacterium]